MNNSLNYSLRRGVLRATSQCIAPAAEKPSATTGARLRREEAVPVAMAALVESIDHAKREVTLKGPRGNCRTARVADPSRLTPMRIGESIAITSTEALAVSLEKAKQKSGK